jgi:group I intron endonuclease
METGIYQIVNQVNGKKYIGSTYEGFRVRWQRHVRELKQGRHHCMPLQRSWLKHGEDNFKFEIIIECTKEEMKDLEQFYIDEIGDYNVCKIAGTVAGAPISDEIRQQIALKQSKSLTFRGETHTYREWEEILGLARGSMGRRVCDFGAASEKTFTPPAELWEMQKPKMLAGAANRLGCVGANKGKTFDEEWRKNLSEAHKGNKLSPESIAKRTEKQTGLKRTEETKKNMSDSQVKSYTYKGITLTSREWEIKLGLGYGSLKQRICKYKDDIDKIFRPKVKNQYA